MNMKKTYIQPQVEAVNLTTEGMIAVSRLGFDDTAGGEQLTNKKQPGIWGGEEQKEKGGIW
jgi:hypothetical protein